MYRWNNRFLWMGIAAMVTVSQSAPILAETVEVSQEEAEAEAEVKLCGEDECIVLPTRDDEIFIFDSAGKKIAQLSDYMEAYTAYCYPRNSFLVSGGESSAQVFSLGTMQVVGEFPWETTQIVCGKEVFLVSDKISHQMTLYNMAGEPVVQVEAECSPYKRGYETILLPIKSGFLMAVSGMDGVTAYWVEKDGSNLQKIDDPMLNTYFRDHLSSVSVYGDSLVLHDYDKKESTVIDLDGTVRLAGMRGELYEYNSLIYTPYESYISWVYKIVDGVCVLYNEQLTPENQTPVNELETEYGVSLESENRFVKGFPYESLGGRLCAGYIKVNGEEYLPYAREGDTFFLEQEGQLQTWNLEYLEEPTQKNDRYLLTRKEDPNGNSIFRLRDIRTQEIVWESPVEEDSRGMDLQKDSILYTKYSRYGEPTGIIYDLDLKEKMPETRAYVYSWRQGFYFMRRGIYTGITDDEGNWKIRLTSYTE